MGAKDLRIPYILGHNICPYSPEKGGLPEEESKESHATVAGSEGDYGVTEALGSGWRSGEPRVDDRGVRFAEEQYLPG